jgi:protein-tyrosine-phosphatase
MVKSGRRWVPTTIGSIDEPRILLLCTGNQCRSPMAEGLLRDLLHRRGVVATVDSAGLLDGGMPATSTATDVLADRGIDLTAHRSRSMADPAVVLEGADLVLAMERRHLREAVVAEPAIRHRTFTLVDAVRRAEATTPRRPDEGLRAWAERLGAGRTAVDAQGTGEDEIPDPIGQPRSRYEATADRLADLLGRLLDQAWPPASRTEQSA